MSVICSNGLHRPKGKDSPSGKPSRQAEKVSTMCGYWCEDELDIQSDKQAARLLTVCS